MGTVDESLWAANDHLGTVNQLLDGDSNVVEHREYDSFGTIDQAFSESGLVKSTDSLLSDVAHSGSFWDEDARLYQKRARWYDPGTGRFIGEDPIGFADGPNPFKYAGNNPILMVDPTGYYQQGHPYDSLAGAFAGGVVADVNRDLQYVSNSYGVLAPQVNSVSSNRQLSAAGIPWAAKQTPVNYAVMRPDNSLPSFSETVLHGPQALSASAQWYRSEQARASRAPSLAAVQNNYFSDPQLVRAGEEIETRQSLEFLQRRGNTAEAAGAAFLLSAERKHNAIVGGLIASQAEPLFFAIDTGAKLTGNGNLTSEFGQRQLSQTYQTFNSDPNATVLQNLGTGTLDTGKAIIQYDTFRTGYNYAVNPTIENAHAFSDNLFNTSLVTLGTGVALKQLQGVPGSVSLDDVVGSLSHNADVAVELTRRATARGRITNSPQAFGSRAHLLFRRLNERLDRNLIDQGSPFRVSAEEFRNVARRIVPANARGSIGADVIIRNADDIRINEIFDLKTHGGIQRPMSPVRQGQIIDRFGAPAQEIFRQR